MLNHHIITMIFLLYLFSREFDEVLLRKIVDISYEDEVNNLPHAPDVSHFMMSEVLALVPDQSFCT